MQRLAILLVVTCTAASAIADDAELRVHLPREVSVRGDTLTLGRVALCRSSNEKLTQRAEQIAMGRAPFSGEALVIKRSTVLSRLASSGIHAERVRISGADTVTVSRKEHVVDSEAILAAAEQLLKDTKPGPDGCVWRLVRKPEDLPVPAGDEVSVKASLAESNAGNEVRILVSAVNGEKTLGTRELSYRIMYPWRQAVAAADLPAGTVLTEENITISTSTSHRPQSREWQPPVGQITIRPVSAGTVLRDSMLRGARPSIVVERNETVVMKIDGEGFSLHWLGRAMDSGGPGDIIRIRNVDSNRVVSARVAYDGTVQPVYEGMEQ